MTSNADFKGMPLADVEYILFNRLISTLYYHLDGE